MRKVLWFLAVIVLCVLGYYAFGMGWILVKTFVGLMFIAIFGMGFWLGRITKS